MSDWNNWSSRTARDRKIPALRFSISLANNWDGGSDEDINLFAEWLRTIPRAVEGIKVDGVFTDSAATAATPKLAHDFPLSAKDILHRDPPTPSNTRLQNEIEQTKADIGSRPSFDVEKSLNSKPSHPAQEPPILQR